jgi:hypothetical protein
VAPWARILWRQLGAAIETLENAVRACPDALWDPPSEDPCDHFWYWAYHAAFYLDHYLSDREEGFAPPPPFDLSEFDPSGRMPPRTYSKEEVLAYLAHSRRKAAARMAALTTEDAVRRCAWARRDLSAAELVLYDMRHVQHHAAQLNLLLRQKAGLGLPWVSAAKDVPRA